jgi:hypothetical protein
MSDAQQCGGGGMVANPNEFDSRAAAAAGIVAQ